MFQMSQTDCFYQGMALLLCLFNVCLSVFNLGVLLLWYWKNCFLCDLFVFLAKGTSNVQFFLNKGQWLIMYSEYYTVCNILPLYLIVLSVIFTLLLPLFLLLLFFFSNMTSALGHFPVKIVRHVPVMDLL